MNVRSATAQDVEFILGLSGRFAECDLPEGRTASEVEAGTRRELEQALGRDPGAADACLLVAESDAGERLGFVYAHEVADFFTGERYGHVADIAVAPGAEGIGAGETLMVGAQNWALARGYAHLGLNVFAGNGRARRFYERLGFVPETVAYRKQITS